MNTLQPIPISAIREARDRIADLALRTPLVRLESDQSHREIYLKLENLQPMGSFKVRGAANALRRLERDTLTEGVYTASAGNMAQGLAYAARKIGVSCGVVVPDHAPGTKLAAIERLGAEIVKVPFDEWWQVLRSHRFDRLAGRFVHPVCDADVIAGHGTIGLEIVEDLPDVDAVVIPFGGGGLSSGIASALRALKPETRVYAAEVETAAPLSASLAAGEPRAIDYTPSFVDGIGGKGILEEMWPLVSSLLDGAIVATLEQTADAIRLLAERSRVVAEGAGAASVAAALAADFDAKRVVCVVSGGNIDAAKLATILGGGIPAT